MKRSIALTQLYLNLIVFCMLINGGLQNRSVADSTIRFEITRVTSGENISVEGVKCIIERPGGKSESKRTNKKGICEFSNKKPGTYFFRFNSKNYREKLKNWALPLYMGPEEIEQGLNTFEVESRKAAKIKGIIRYDGNVDLTEASISSNKGQISTEPKQSGIFLLNGVMPTEENKVQILLLTRKTNFSLLYRRIVEVPPDKLKSEKIFNIGKVEFPRAESNEYIQLQINNSSNEGEKATRSEIQKAGYELYIENKEGTIFFKGIPSLLSLYNKSNKKLYLPSGKYQLWWRGFKDQKVYNFDISQDHQPTLEVSLPETNE